MSAVINDTLASDTPIDAIDLDDTTPLDIVTEIEAVITSLDQTNSAMVSHGDQGHLWKFQYGSVEVFVQLTGTNDEDVLTVWSEILSLDSFAHPQLFQHLLELNWLRTLEAKFATRDGHVVVVITRPIEDISPGEIARAMTLVATIADEYDDILQAEFAQS
jgi:hypothetical protein